MNLDSQEYSLNFRHIGLNAVLGDLEKNMGNPSEVGVLCIINSKNPNICTEIAKLINPFLLHFPLTVDEDLPNFFTALLLTEAEKIIAENRQMMNEFGFELSESWLVEKLENT